LKDDEEVEGEPEFAKHVRRLTKEDERREADHLSPWDAIKASESWEGGEDDLDSDDDAESMFQPVTKDQDYNAPDTYAYDAYDAEQANRKAGDEAAIAAYDAHMKTKIRNEAEVGELDQQMGAPPTEIPIDHTEEKIFIQQMRDAEKARLLYYKELESIVAQTANTSPHLASMAVKGQ